VLKPSEKTPLAALALGQYLTDAGLAPDHVNIVTGDPGDIVAEMLAHEAVDLVSFTGSTAVGRSIAERLGYRRAVLELGGNDPLIVLPEADLQEACRLGVAGAFRNSGQRCTAIKRLLVHDDVADRFVELLSAGARALVVGDPLDPETDVGTLISEEAASTLERRILDAIDAGARLEAGGSRHGAQLAPTVLDRVAPDVELVVEESFGPIAPVIRIRSLDEAIDVANGTRFGLSAGIVTNDLRAINRCIRELRCGSVNVREAPGFRSELAPFGGTKDSGIGVKEGVLEAMRAMTFTKLFTLPWD
jgi:aldehyde dehydrogenase (NAD+)